MDLAVGRRRPRSGLVLTDDFVSLEHPLCKALSHIALRGVMVEAPTCDQIELAVVILIRPAEQQPLVGSDEFDCDSQHELTDVVCVAEGLLTPMQGQHLLTQLTCPFPFRLTRSFHSEARVLLVA